MRITEKQIHIMMSSLRILSQLSQVPEELSDEIDHLLNVIISQQSDEIKEYGNEKNGSPS